jgi:hypothetical protein
MYEYKGWEESTALLTPPSSVKIAASIKSDEIQTISAG